MKPNLYRNFVILACALLLPLVGFSQRAGDLDRSFNFGKGENYQFNYGYGANRDVLTSILQPDNKVIIGGSFSSYNGKAIGRIARLNTDGSLDTTFNSGTGTNNSVWIVASQPDGKIIIGGSFITYNDIPRNNIARLNADGSLDTTFNQGIGTNGTVFSIAIQPDGKILIGGIFTTYDGIVRNRIARLNADGRLDGTFNMGTEVNDEVSTIAMQSDGKLMIAGNFTTCNGIARNRIARLNADGRLDTTFNPGTGANISVNHVELQPDGKIIISGAFNTYNAVARKSIARLNSDGSLDTSFNPGTGASSWIYTSALQNDGKIIIGGFFSTFNGTTRNNIARLHNNGSLDTNFNLATGANSQLYAAVLQLDGKIIIGGGFTDYNGITKKGIARINEDGSLDASFNPGIGANYAVKTIAPQNDGKIIIAGQFNFYNDSTLNQLARLNADGSLDSTFNFRSAPNNIVHSIVVQPDGKIIVGGSFTSYSNIPRFNIARLNIDGSLDETFNFRTGYFGTVQSIALQPDGKIIIGGSFTAYEGRIRNGIARLNANGSLDLGFNPGNGFNYEVTKVALQTDGKIIVGGAFTSYNGTIINRIARLNANGSLDETFDTGIGANDIVLSVALQTDGKIVLGGDFTSFNGIGRNRIARLNINGSLDATFNPGIGMNESVLSIALQTDGKMVVGGYFTAYNGTTINYLARINADGILDTAFNLGTENRVYNVTLQADSKIIIGGLFSGYGGFSTPGIARIHGLNVTSASKKSINAPQLKLYPNPTTGIVYLTTSSDAQTITIVNAVGQLVFTTKAQPEMEINLNHLASGVYMVQVQSGKGVTTQRLVIQ